MEYLKSLYLNNRFFISAGVVIGLFLLAYIFPVFFIVGQITLLLISSLIVYDIILLFSPGSRVEATRLCAKRFSNGDENKVQIILENKYPILIRLNVIDEVPHQFQRRDINFLAELKRGESKILEYSLRPVKRGTYQFGLIRVFVSTTIGLVKRRFSCDAEKSVDVYPSYLQLQKYELMAISSNLSELGIKKVRKIGHNIEFEHIKEYVEGDDYRTINWKATARKNDLMVNLYQDEKSQNVYSLIDKGRMMQMPFEGMSLLDYAINSSLVLSNIAIKKDDKAGVMTFEKAFDGFLPAAKRRNQMHLILNFLYNQSTTFGETDYSNLYVQLKNRVKRRSLLLLYTNFESIHSLDRQLPYFQKLAKSHLLVVIFFENTELEALIDKKPKDTLGIYQKVVAEKFAFEKVQIVKTLRRYGIQAILSKPQELSINVINKYIELKARQMI
ncbi:MAG: DUF58 domain-containing protein [Cyclobacteriaceae bacterium]|nr:DUF58 domain-containing protein [Cyclobacteriaceae bacterium]